MATDQPIPRYYYGAGEGRDYREHMTGIAEAIERAISSNTSAAELTYQGGQTRGLRPMSQKFGAIRSGFVQGMGRFNDTLVLASGEVCSVLDKINGDLSNPFLEKSRKLYRRALLNYSKGFYEEAVEDLDKAIEINKTDYIAWFLLGKTYLFGAGEFSCVIDPDAAIRSFTTAAKYIKPDIAGHHKARLTAAEILFHLGLARQTKAKDSAFKQNTKEDAKLAADAKRAYDQSWACSNEMLEALYNSARYDIILGDEKAALEKLQTVIQKDPGYAEESMRDSDFAPLYGDIPRMVGLLRDKLYPQAKKIALELSGLKQELEPQYDLPPSELAAIFGNLPNKELSEASSYFDVLHIAANGSAIRNALFDFHEKGFSCDADETGEGVTITKYTGKASRLVIPQTYRGKPITGIGKWAFNGCFGLTSVVIPQGVTSIGESAFSGCSGLTSAVIPQGVVRIGESAFFGCSGLTSITIPQGVTSIGKTVFFRCSSLTSAVIPQGVTSIGESAFSGCSGLTSVVIPQGVTRIGERAFSGCSGLTSVVIPQGVISIGEGAFCACSGLTSVVIPQSVVSIGESAFFDCESLSYECREAIVEKWGRGVI